jgi:hypothetical protein
MAANRNVRIADFAFGRASVTVREGDTVTWSNSDEAPHTATADDGSFDTGVMDPGQSASVTFQNAGTYTYFCAIHPSMTARVVVKAAGAGAGAASDAPTDGPTAAPTDEGTAAPTARAGAPDPTQPATDAPDFGGAGAAAPGLDLSLAALLLVGIAGAVSIEVWRQRRAYR